MKSFFENIMSKKFSKFVVFNPEYVIFKKQTGEEIKIVDEMHKYTNYVFNLIKDEDALNQSYLECTTIFEDNIKIYSKDFDTLICEVENTNTSYTITILF